MKEEQINQLELLINAYKIAKNKVAIQKNLHDGGRTNSYLASITEREQAVMYLTHYVAELNTELKESDSVIDIIKNEGEATRDHLRQMMQRIEELSKRNSLEITLPPTVTIT